MRGQLQLSAIYACLDFSVAIAALMKLSNELAAAAAEGSASPAVLHQGKAASIWATNTMPCHAIP